jgi:competence protein ComEC
MLRPLQSSARWAARSSNAPVLALAMALVGSRCDSSSDPSRSVGSTAPGSAGSLEAGGPGSANATGSNPSGASTTAAGAGSVREEGVNGIAGGLMGTGSGPSASPGGNDAVASTGPDAAPAEPPVTGTLSLYFVDSEGGQSTVIQLPNGQILVIDTGNPGMRDGERMLAVLEDELGATEIDYLLTTHYDADHVGGVPYLAARMGIGQFLDHGDANAPAQYLNLANAGVRRGLVAGDVLSLGGVTLEVVSAGGTVITEPLAGGGLPNPFCQGAQATLPGDPLDENVNSVGVVLRFGRFDFIDLGDLLWPREHQLACPDHQIGPVDLYLTTHHGLTRSGAPQLVRGLGPLAAIMNNGPRKGGGGNTWNTLALSPGGPNVWQVHRVVTAPDDQNAPPDQIANLDEGQADAANFLKVTVESTGQFTILNPRTNFSTTYTSR